MGKVRRGGRRKRSAANTATPPDTTTGDGTESRWGPFARIDAYIARFAQPSNGALALSFAGVVSSNAYLLWRVARGDLPTIGIVLLVLAESALLVLLAALQLHFIPAADRAEAEETTLAMRIFSWIGFVVVFGGGYLFWSDYIDESRTLEAFLSSFAPWRKSGLDIALAISLLFALGGVAADQLHYRRAGPPFISSVQLEATARRMTFACGVFVVALPILGMLMLAVWVVPRLIVRRDSATLNFIGGASIISVVYASVFAVTGLAAKGVIGWACVYLWGKTLVECLFVALPLVAVHKRAAMKATGGARVATG